MPIIPEALLDENLERNREIAFKEYQISKDLKQTKIQTTHHIVVFLKSGSKLIHTPTKTLTFASPALFIVKKGNYLMAEKLLKDLPHYQSSIFFFSDRQVEDYLHKYKIAKADTINQRVFPLNYHPSYHAWLEHYQSYTQHSPVVFEFLELRLEELFLQLMQHAPQFAQIFHSLLNQPAHFDMMQLIDDKLTSPVNIEELAFLSHMSLSTFKRKFKQEFGTSPGKYIRKRRLHIAKEKLELGTSTGSHLYYELGYESHSSFITAFKREFGLSPDEFKRQHAI